MATPTGFADPAISFFFDKDDSGRFSCRNDEYKRTRGFNGSSASNLRAHLLRCIGPHYRHSFEEHVKKAGKNRLGVTSHVNVTERDKDIFHWLRFVIGRSMPLTEVDDKVTQQLVKRNTVHSRTLSKYIPRLVCHVRTALKTLPEVFGIMIDGWTSSSTHYIAVIATYIDEDGEYNERLLGCSPLLNEAHYGAAEHRDLFVYVLGLYGRGIEDIKVLIGDDCSTNKKLAGDLKVPLIGCANHKLNLAIRAIILNDSELGKSIAAVEKIMGILRTLKGAFALRDEGSELCAVRNNLTRWCSKFYMLERYLAIEDASRKIPEMCGLMPVGESRLHLVEMCRRFKNYCELNDMLQTKGLSYVDATKYITIACADHPELRSYLGVDTEKQYIVQDRVFEEALLKVSSGQVHGLTEEEEAALEPLEKHEVESSNPRPFKRRKEYAASLKERARDAEKEKADRVYVDLNFIPVSTASVERLFSQAKLILTD